MRTTLGLFVALVVSASGAAQAQEVLRTWVSAVGDDANPCSRTAPCATFAVAIANTVVGGEVDALDAGDFGPVSLTGAITIDGRAAGGGIEGAGVSSVTIDAGPTDVVVIRGLSIRGNGSAGGVVFNSGAGLHLEDSYVFGFQDGIVFTPPAGGQLMLTGVDVKGNGGAGVLVGSSGGTATATMAGSRSEGNDVGVRAVAGARVALYDCDASRNVTAGISAEVGAGGGVSEINLEEVAVTQNDVGVRATAAAGTAVVRMSKVLATANGTSPIASSGGGAILSFGNNRLDLVPALALSSTAPSQQVTAGDTASYSVAVAVTGLTSAPIAFACSGLPPGASCRFTPATLPAGTRTGSVTVEVTTTAMSTSGGFLSRSSSPAPPLAPMVPLLAMALGLAGLATAKRRSLRRPLGALVGLMLLGGLVTVAACGSSASPNNRDLANGGEVDMSDTPDLGSAPDLAIPPAPTPPGTYPLQLTGTSGALTGTLPLTLVVN
ncbi:MAG: hypothetical protein JWN44_600 [Myxococcales bacterium]|nr:hypothetical protein [Myxococcales bacterium]